MEKEFTLKDVTDAMHSGVFITHKGFDAKEYIYFKNGNWKTEKGDPAGYVTFHDLENWSYWHYPKKMVKRAFYKPIIYCSLSDHIEESGIHHPNTDEDNACLTKHQTILRWETIIEEIPVSQLPPPKGGGLEGDF